MMGRAALDHILRAAGEVTGRRAFVLVGSAAIFAWVQTVPAALARTREADIFALDVSDDEAERISFELDANLGQASLFDERFGYYCDGVGPNTAILPDDWRDHATVYRSPATNGVSALAPQPADICASKLCAGREKDLEWVREIVREGLVDPAHLMTRVRLLSGKAGLDTTTLIARAAAAARA